MIRTCQIFLKHEEILEALWLRKGPRECRLRPRSRAQVAYSKWSLIEITALHRTVRLGTGGPFLMRGVRHQAELMRSFKTELGHFATLPCQQFLTRGVGHQVECMDKLFQVIAFAGYWRITPWCVGRLPRDAVAFARNVHGRAVDALRWTHGKAP